MEIGQEDFFGEEKKIRREVSENKELSTTELEAKTKFFRNDLATLLGQGPIRKTPARNSIEKKEEANSPEIKNQIKEIFGENYDTTIL